MPLIPGFEGQYGTSKATALQAITHWNYRSISQGQQSLLARLAKEVGDPHRYICFFGLRTWSEMNGRLVSEIVYVHSKLAIVDDNRVLIGSANINDRSLVGDRDSEISVLFEDTEFIHGTMNGENVQVGKFASNLRKRLFREHLGDFDGTQINYQDPISDSFYKDTWLSTAARNTTMFEKVLFLFIFWFLFLFLIFRYLIVFQRIQHLHLLNYEKFNQLQNFVKQILKKHDVYFNQFVVI